MLPLILALQAILGKAYESSTKPEKTFRMTTLKSDDIYATSGGDLLIHNVEVDYSDERRDVNSHPEGSLTSPDLALSDITLPFFPRQLLSDYDSLYVSVPIIVASTSQYSVRNRTFTQAGNFDAAFAIFRIDGKLVLENCFFEGFSARIFEIFGEAQISNSSFRSNRGVAFDLKASSIVSLSGVTVEYHTGSFLSYPLQLGQPNISLLLCVFLMCATRGSEYLFQIRTYASISPGSVSISQTQFSTNSIPLILLDIGFTAVRISDSVFVRNTAVVFTVYQRNLEVAIMRCELTSNYQTWLTVRHLQGRIYLQDILVSGHLSVRHIQISNDGATSQCFLEISRLHVLRSTFSSQDMTASIVSVSQCTTLIANVSIQETVLLAKSNANFVALFVAQRGVMRIENLETEGSGSSGQLVDGIYSTLSLFNCSFTNSIARQSFYFIGIISNLDFSYISLINYQGVGVSNEFTPFGIVYFGFQQSFAVLRNITISHFGHFWVTIVLAPVSSNCSISGVSMDKATVSVFYAAIASVGEIADFRATNCDFSVFVFQTASGSILSILRSAIIGSTFTRDYSGILSLSSKSRVFISDMAVSLVSTNNIIKANNAYLEAEYLTISNCVLASIFHNVISSTLVVSNLVYVNSTGGLAYGYSSQIRVIDSRIDSVRSPQSFLSGNGANVTLAKVTVRNCSSVLAIAYMHEGSVLALSAIDVTLISSDQSLGFEIVGGELSIAGSSFSAFHCSLIQATLSFVRITHTIFKDSTNVVQSRISKIAFGGVLGCVNCFETIISYVKVRGVSSGFGGAFAFRTSTLETNGVVDITESTFDDCRASVGGAIYIRNVGFSVKSCQFHRNLAELTGGAMDVSVGQNSQRMLKNVYFDSNSAIQGGALKWLQAQISTSNLTFSNNLAHYGPDLASFGVTLSSHLTHFSPNTASGYPLALTYEILDHYSQRVTTTREEVLYLHSSVNISFPGYENVVRSQGLLNFTVPVVLAAPGSTQVLSASVWSIEGGFNMSDSRLVTFRNCSQGEVQKPDRCQYCFSGNVSFHPSDQECSECPKHALCLGGASLTVDAHYWRLGTDSMAVMECPLADKCLGGETSECATGFQGTLCNECAPGYYRMQATGCGECGPTAGVYAKFLPILAVLVLFAFLSVRFSATEADEFKLYVVKTAFNHAQLLTSIAPLKATLPITMHNYLHGVSYFSSFLISDLPTACLGLGNGTYLIAGAATAFPLLLTFAGVTLLLTSPCAWKRRVIIVYTSLWLFLPSIAIQCVFPLLACIAVDDARWLFTDMSEKCWSDTHSSMVFILFLPTVALSVLLPIAIVSIFALSADFPLYFPMWTAGYRLRLWELTQMCIKQTLLVLVYSGLAFSRVGQFSSGLILLYLLCFVNVFFFPQTYSIRQCFWLSEGSYLIATMCYSIGGLYVFQEGGYAGTNVTFSIAFVLLNSVFFLVCACLLVWNVRIDRLGVSTPPVKTIHCFPLEESYGDAFVPNNSVNPNFPTPQSDPA